MLAFNKRSGWFRKSPIIDVTCLWSKMGENVGRMGVLDPRCHWKKHQLWYQPTFLTLALIFTTDPSLIYINWKSKMHKMQLFHYLHLLPKHTSKSGVNKKSPTLPVCASTLPWSQTMSPLCIYSSSFTLVFVFSLYIELWVNFDCRAAALTPNQRRRMLVESSELRRWFEAVFLRNARWAGPRLASSSSQSWHIKHASYSVTFSPRGFLSPDK